MKDAGLSAAAAVLIWMPLMAPDLGAPLNRSAAGIELTDFGDPPKPGRRHTKKMKETSSSQAVQPRAPELKGETEEQHSKYLKRYGF